MPRLSAAAWSLIAILLAILFWAVAVRAGCWTVDVLEVVHVVDGDTFDARVATWPSGIPGRVDDPETKTERIRLLGVDTPELEKPTLEAGRAAKAFTAAWLQERNVTITVCRRDSTGRLLAVVEGTRRLADDVRAVIVHESLARALLDAGHALPFRP